MIRPLPTAAAAAPPRAFRNEFREPVKGQHVQPRETRQRTGASNCRSSWKVACLGAISTSGGPSGDRWRAARISPAAVSLAAARRARRKRTCISHISSNPPAQRRKGIFPPQAAISPPGLPRSAAVLGCECWHRPVPCTGARNFPPRNWRRDAAKTRRRGRPRYLTCHAINTYNRTVIRRGP